MPAYIVVMLKGKYNIVLVKKGILESHGSVGCRWPSLREEGCLLAQIVLSRLRTLELGKEVELDRLLHALGRNRE